MTCKKFCYIIIFICLYLSFFNGVNANKGYFNIEPKNVNKFIHSSNGEKIAYVKTNIDGNMFLIINGIEGKGYKNIGKIKIINDNDIAYIATINENEMVLVLNRKEISKHNEIKDFDFSNDLTSYFVITDKGLIKDGVNISIKEYSKTPYKINQIGYVNNDIIYTIIEFKGMDYKTLGVIKNNEFIYKNETFFNFDLIFSKNKKNYAFWNGKSEIIKDDEVIILGDNSISPLYQFSPDGSKFMYTNDGKKLYINDKLISECQNTTLFRFSPDSSNYACIVCADKKSCSGWEPSVKKKIFFNGEEYPLNFYLTMQIFNGYWIGGDNPSYPFEISPNNKNLYFLGKNTEQYDDGMFYLIHNGIIHDNISSIFFSLDDFLYSKKIENGKYTIYKNLNKIFESTANYNLFYSKIFDTVVLYNNSNIILKIGIDKEVIKKDLISSRLQLLKIKNGKTYIELLNEKINNFSDEELLKYYFSMIKIDENNFKEKKEIYNYIKYLITFKITQR